jgi:hypothetical protein
MAPFSAVFESHARMARMHASAAIPTLHLPSSTLLPAPPPPNPQQAGPTGAPADLGLPDSEGVYTYEGRGGAQLFFRLAPPTRADGKAEPGPAQWQWSTSKRLWLPTSAVSWGGPCRVALVSRLLGVPF